MGKPFDELTIADNFMFSKVMRNTKISKHFLELILGKKIRKVTIPDYEHTIDIRYDSKSVRLDVILEDNKNTVYNLEMQATEQKFLPKRSRYYQDLIDLDLLEKGGSYDELNHSIVIFVCAFDPFGKDRILYRFKNLCVEETSLSLGDETEKIFVNINGTRGKISKELKDTLALFRGETSERTTAFAGEIEDEVEQVKLSKRWRAEYMTLQVFLDDAKREGREAGWEEGHKEGHKEGREEGEIKEKKKGILTLLNVKGVVPKSLEEYIFSVEDKNTLDELFLIAAKTNSVEEFEKMRNQSEIKKR